MTDKFFVMSIPDNDDGASWFVVKRSPRYCEELPSFTAARERARELNKRDEMERRHE
jgi:hypothetical protein